MKVLRLGKNTEIHVYQEKESCEIPHCHVVENGESKSLVSLPLLELVCGNGIDRELKKLLEDNLELLADVWDELNFKQ